MGALGRVSGSRDSDRSDRALRCTLPVAGTASKRSIGFRALLGLIFGLPCQLAVSCAHARSAPMASVPVTRHQAISLR